MPEASVILYFFYVNNDDRSPLGTKSVCDTMISNTWNLTVLRSPSFLLSRKIKLVSNKLKKWNKKVFGNLQERRKSLEYELQRAQPNLTSSQLCTNEKELRTELESLEEQE